MCYKEGVCNIGLKCPVFKITKKTSAEISSILSPVKKGDVSTKKTRKLTWTSQTLEVIDIYCGTNDIPIYRLKRGGNSLPCWDSMFFLNTVKLNTRCKSSCQTPMSHFPVVICRAFPVVMTETIPPFVFLAWDTKKWPYFKRIHLSKPSFLGPSIRQCSGVHKVGPDYSYKWSYGPQ